VTWDRPDESLTDPVLDWIDTVGSGPAVRRPATSQLTAVATVSL